MSGNVARFPGLIPDSIDLSNYLEPEESFAIRPASYFTDRVLERLAGRHSRQGTPLPWSKAEGKFELRRGELTIWTGFKGHGKSMLLSQVLSFAMVRGERVFIISPEFKPDDVLNRKVRQAAATDKPADAFARRFLSWAGNDRLWLFDHQGSLSPDKVIGIMRYAIEEHGATHVLVDSLMKCGMAPDDYQRQKKFVDDLQSIAHQRDVHVHLVCHARKGESDEKPARLHDVKGASELCDMAENVCSVWKNKRKLEAHSKNINRHDDEMDALLVVDSQRNGDGWTGAIALWFDSKSFQFLGERNHAPVSWTDLDADGDPVEF